MLPSTSFINSITLYICSILIISHQLSIHKSYLCHLPSTKYHYINGIARQKESSIFVTDNLMSNSELSHRRTYFLLVLALLFIWNLYQIMQQWVENDQVLYIDRETYCRCTSGWFHSYWWMMCCISKSRYTALELIWREMWGLLKMKLNPDSFRNF
jgi:hypothetical protein